MAVKNPFISVIMPVYNGELFLIETIESLLSQTFKNFELICIDDSSTDNSLAILKNYAEKDTRIRIFSKSNEKLASFGVKLGLEKAKGQYYMYTSQDDLYSLDLLEKLAGKASEKEADVVVPNLVCYVGDKEDISYRTFWSETIPEPENITHIDAFVLSLTWRLHGFCLFKTSLARKVGIYTFNYNSDEYTVRKLFLACRKFAFCDGIFYYRINNPHAITKKMSIKLYDVFQTNEMLEQLAQEEKVSHNIIITLRELALNDVAIRQKFLFMNGDELTKEEFEIARKKTREAYFKIKDKHELFRHNSVRRLLLTHGFCMLKLAVWIRTKIKR